MLLKDPFIISGEHKNFPGIYYRIFYHNSESRPGYGQLLIGDSIAKIGTFYPYTNSKIRHLNGGKSLLQRMIEDVKSASITRISAITRNKEMQDFLNKSGFNKIDEIHDYMNLYGKAKLFRHSAPGHRRMHISLQV